MPIVKLISTQFIYISTNLSKFSDSCKLSQKRTKEPQRCVTNPPPYIYSACTLKINSHAARPHTNHGEQKRSKASSKLSSV